MSSRPVPATTGSLALLLLCLLGLTLATTGGGGIAPAPGTRPAIQIDTPGGTIRGGRCRGADDVDYFFSIPYAKPPVGDLRFAPPVPHTGAYDGVLDGTAAAPSCPQFGTAFAEGGPQDEDWSA